MSGDPIDANRRFALAHLTAPNLTLPEYVRCAAAAGFDFADLRLAPVGPSEIDLGARAHGSALAEARQQLVGLGLRVHDIELIRLAHDTRPHDWRALFELANSFGAEQVKCVSDIEGKAHNVEVLGGVCRMAAEYDLAIAFEYVAFAGVRTQRGALAVFEQIGASNLRLVVDALHVVRSGESIDDLTPEVWPDGSSVQVCDGPVPGPTTHDGLVYEARTARMVPGTGAFPLRALLAMAPAGSPISVEVPVTPLPSTFDESVTHAERCLTATRAIIDRLQEDST